MAMKKLVLLPRFLKILEQLGENIKLARKRRKLTTHSGVRTGRNRPHHIVSH